MGNCTVKGTTLSCTADRAAAVAAYRAAVRVRVLTASGGVMELFGPVEVGTFLGSFPGHGVFRPGDCSSPLLHQELLQNGRLYYLLPLDRLQKAESSTEESTTVESPITESPARNVEVLRQQVNGVWGVKLAMEAQTLASLLAGGGAEAEGFIQRMRAIAGSEEVTPPHARKGRAGGGDAGKSPAVRHFERA